MTLNVTTIGNSMKILLPKEALKKMNASKGDTLMPYQQDFEKQLDAALKGLGSRIHQRFMDDKSIELELPARSATRPAPDFSDAP